MKIIYIPNRIIDSDGIADGATVHVYQSGTTTHVNIYSDPTYATPMANPFSVAAGAEFPAVYTNYSGDVRLYIENVYSGEIQDTDPYDLSSLVPSERTINVYDYGARDDNATDNAAAIQAALDAAKVAGGGTVVFPFTNTGFYNVNTGLVLTSNVDKAMNIRLQGAPGVWLSTSSAIDVFTISNTSGGTGNTRRVLIDGLGIKANNTGARGLVLSEASYNQFTNMDFVGGGDAIICGTALSNTNQCNQFNNIRITQPKTGIYITGLYNIFTNVVINEGLTGGAYGIKIDGNYCVVDDFVVRGNGGAGGTALVEITSSAAGSVLANGTVFDSYAVGVSAGAARHIRVSNVTINSSQTHGLLLNGCTQGRFDVNLNSNGVAAADTYHQITTTNIPTDNIVIAQFAGTNCLLDINEISAAANNTWICSSLPNGKSILGTGSTVVSSGRISARLGIGYDTGDGGSVAQITSKATGVTLDKICGSITMNNAALAANTTVSFTLTNAKIAADDLILVRVKSGYATAATYRAWAEGNAAGSRTIVLQNISGGSLSEAVVLGFTVIKSASS